MPSHTFTASPPDDMLTIQLGAPPPGATALLIRAQLIPPPNPGAETVRLLHLRRAGKGLRPAASQIVELLFNGATRVYTAAFSGFGAHRAKALPQHLGAVKDSPVDVSFTVPLVPGAEAIVAVEGLQGHAVPDLLAAGPLELLAGFTGPGDLRPPVGWAVLWDSEAIQWQPATTSNPAFPPVGAPGSLAGGSLPPAPPPVVQPSPGVPPPAGNGTPREVLVADLKAAVARYAAAEVGGGDPLVGLIVAGLITRLTS